MVDRFAFIGLIQGRMVLLEGGRGEGVRFSRLFFRALTKHYKDAIKFFCALGDFLKEQAKETFLGKIVFFRARTPL